MRATTERGHEDLRPPVRATFDQLANFVLKVWSAVGTRRVTTAEMAQLAGYAGPENGRYQEMVSGLKRLGLLDGQSGALRLTPLAERYVTAPDPAAAAAVAAEALMNDDWMSAFVARFAGRRVPDGDELAREIREAFGVAESRVERVAKQTLSSLRCAGLLSDDGTLAAPPDLRSAPWPAPQQAAGDALVTQAVRMLPPRRDGWSDDVLDDWLEALRRVVRLLHRTHRVEDGSRG